MSGNERTLFASGSDAALEALLSQARAIEPDASEALTARILADAAQVSAQRAAVREAAARTLRKPLPQGLSGKLADWLRLLGGIPAAAAFCAALGLGVATGAAAPRWTDQGESLSAALDGDPLQAALQVSQTIDLLSSDDPMEGS